MKVRNEILNAISETCTKLKIDGYRPDLALVKASRAFAALDGRTIVEPEDVLKVSQFALGHRTRGEGQEPMKRQAIEDNFRNILFNKVPKRPEEMVPEPPAPSKDIISKNLTSPKSIIIRQKRRQREISVPLQQAISIALMFLLLFSISIGALLFKGILLHVPVQRTLTFDQILLTMGISAIILIALIFLFPGETVI